MADLAVTPLETLSRPDEFDRDAAPCVRLCGRMGLLLAGIDLKETPDGEYYCFEVNPSPGFAYYEQHTGQPISAVLVEALNQPLPSRQKEVALLA